MPRFYNSPASGSKSTDVIPPCRVVVAGKDIPVEDIAWLDTDSKECALFLRDQSGAIVFEKNAKSADYGMARVRTVLKNVLIIWQGGIPDVVLSGPGECMMQNAWGSDWNPKDGTSVQVTKEVEGLLKEPLQHLQGLAPHHVGVDDFVKQDNPPRVRGATHEGGSGSPPRVEGHSG